MATANLIDIFLSNTELATCYLPPELVLLNHLAKHGFKPKGSTSWLSESGLSRERRTQLFMETLQDMGISTMVRRVEMDGWHYTFVLESGIGQDE